MSRERDATLNCVIVLKIYSSYAKGGKRTGKVMERPLLWTIQPRVEVQLSFYKDLNCVRKGFQWERDR